MDYISETFQNEAIKKGLTLSIPNVDDIKVPNQAYAAFLRSPYASAKISHIDTKQALSLEGVITVLTGKDWKNSAQERTRSPPLGLWPAVPPCANWS